MKPSLKNLVEVSRISSTFREDREELNSLSKEAIAFLMGFGWCTSIAAAYLALAVPNVFGVFLINLVPTRPEVDNWLWVVVGDIPPAYLVVDHCSDGIKALETYLREMRRWVETVNKGESVEDCIPVNCAPTKKNAKDLSERLTLLNQFISDYQSEK